MLPTTLSLALALAPALPAQAGEDVLILTDGRLLGGLDLDRGEHGYVCHFENGDIFVPDRLVEDALFTGAADFVPRTEEERRMFEEQGKVPYQGSWVSPDRRSRAIEKLLEEKREEIEEMRERSYWRNRYTESTRHFEWQFTVPLHVFEDFRDKMEAYYSDFAKEWRVKPSKKLNICFYANYDEFLRTSGASRGVGGYFMFLGDYDLNIYYDRLDPAETEDIMFHEANHYLQKLVNEDFKMPHFPGESLAEYYGASEWDPDGRKFTTGLIQAGRLAEIKDDVARGEYLDLREMLSSERMYEHYNWGWSFVHFLMNDRSYEKKFKDFFDELANGKDVRRVPAIANLRTVEGPEVLRVFMEEFDLDDAGLTKLEGEWHAYVDSLEAASVRGWEMAARKAVRTDRPLRAKRLLEQAIEAGTENPLTFHRYAGLLHDEGETERAVEYWKMAVELDPLNPTYYYAWGKAIRDENKVEGDRLVALSEELEPDVKNWVGE